MAEEINKDTALEILAGAKALVKQHGDMVREMTMLVHSAAQHDMNYVDSQLLLDVLQRYILSYQEIAKRMK